MASCKTTRNRGMVFKLMSCISMLGTLLSVALLCSQWSIYVTVSWKGILQTRAELVSAIFVHENDNHQEELLDRGSWASGSGVSAFAATRENISILDRIITRLLCPDWQAIKELGGNYGGHKMSWFLCCHAAPTILTAVSNTVNMTWRELSAEPLARTGTCDMWRIVDQGTLLRIASF